MREVWDVEPATADDPGRRSLLEVKTNPAVAISNAAWRQLRLFCSEFGFSPVSRTRLAIEKKDDGAADLAALLSRPRLPKAPPAVN